VSAYFDLLEAELRAAVPRVAAGPGPGATADLGHRRIRVTGGSGSQADPGHKRIRVTGGSGSQADPGHKRTSGAASAALGRDGRQRGLRRTVALTRNNARVLRRRSDRSRVAILLAAGVAAFALLSGLPVATAASTGQCLVPGTDKPLDQLWRPHMLAAIGYTDTRTGDVAFAVRTDHRFYGYRPDHDEWSASVVKAMLMVAYLGAPSVRNRDLNAQDRRLLTPMITESDNDDAQIVFNTVGQGALRALAHRVGMTHFATSPIWGETEVTAADQTRFFLHIDSFIPARHRAYAMSLLAGIVPSQRWGIGEVAPEGW
jgi:hypothetical protein